MSSVGFGSKGFVLHGQSVPLSRLTLVGNALRPIKTILFEKVKVKIEDVS